MISLDNGIKNINTDKISGIYGASNNDIYDAFGLTETNENIDNQVNSIENNVNLNQESNLKNVEIINNESSNSQIITSHSQTNNRILSNRFDDLDNDILAPNDLFEINGPTSSDDFDIFFQNINEKNGMSSGGSNGQLQKDGSNFTNFFSNNIKKSANIQNSPDFNLLLTRATKSNNASNNYNSKIFGGKAASNFLIENQNNSEDQNTAAGYEDNMNGNTNIDKNQNDAANDK
jgi:hypothetical protein